MYFTINDYLHSSQNSILCLATLLVVSILPAHQYRKCIKLEIFSQHPLQALTLSLICNLGYENFSSWLLFILNFDRKPSICPQRDANAFWAQKSSGYAETWWARQLDNAGKRTSRTLMRGARSVWQLGLSSPNGIIFSNLALVNFWHYHSAW